MNTAVLYHGGCADGFGAAYAAWKKFGADAAYTAAHYGAHLPDLENYNHIYVLDFSYPRDVLEAWRQDGKAVQVIDHHRTAQEALAGLDYAIFDMDKSGAVLAWEFFHPAEAVPQLLC